MKKTSQRLRIVELALRDGQQSLLATRMRFKHMEPVLESMDDIGYHAIEAWGGATFDSCLRFLNEDPWERLKNIRKKLKKTPIQMLLRGQNVLGYSHYSDDFVREFCLKSAENGVDIFRIFDALNDLKNIETAVRASQEAGGHVQGALVYTVSPYHTIDVFVKIAKDLDSMGVDSICLKDMSGLLTPSMAFDLVTAIKKHTDLPLNVHSHFTTGMAAMAQMQAVIAGADIIDTCLSPLAFATAHPATGSMIASFENTKYDTGIDKSKLKSINEHFKAATKDIEAEFNIRTHHETDIGVLDSHMPGGMLSNFKKQIKDMGADNAKYEELLLEMPKVRAEAGYPPLVTPTSQIVGTQAFFNVTMGRYKHLTQEFKDLVRGLYGKTTSKPSDELLKIILDLGLNIIDNRPADNIPPQMEKITKELADKGYPKASIEDILSYGLFPQVALKYFKNNR